MESKGPSFNDLDYLFLHKSPMCPSEFEPDQGVRLDNLQLKQMLFEHARVLVVGAGGLGCEILKDLALSGFRDIEIIDMDTIDVTNLNRQFLFRKADVGKAKATVAAQFVMKRCPQVKVKSHVSKIQEFPSSFFANFQIIIAGLDNVEARRWLNFKLHRMVEFDENTKTPDPSTVRPLIDGGTEGFRGQARLILPFSKGACFECTLSTLPREHTYPMCTIAETPRLPEHCIQYAFVVLWEREFGSKPVNKDSPQDMTWLFKKAQERAATFGIEGVTYSLTMGVVKNIIPAIASTNALVSAACVNEALKIATYCAKSVDNYMMFMGQDGVFINTVSLQKTPGCIACSASLQTLEVNGSQTLESFIELLNQKYGFKRATLTDEAQGLLYIPGPPALEEAHHFKLALSISQLVESGHIASSNPTLEVLDKAFPEPLRLRLKIKSEISI